MSDPITSNGAPHQGRPVLLSTLRQHLADNASLLGTSRYDWGIIGYATCFPPSPHPAPEFCEFAAAEP
jgi:hypothetical protein